MALGFRGLKSQVTPLLPLDLEFIASALEESDYSRRPTFGNVTVTPEVADRIVDWGSQKHRGKSIMRVARLYEVYERGDLTGQPLVEIYRPVGGPERRAVANFKKAYRATWDCEYCHCVKWEQVAPLHVRVGGKQEVIRTRTEDWIISSRLRELFERFAIPTRPLENTESFVQIVLGPACTVLSDPTSMWEGDPCPGCGRRVYSRKDWIRGALLEPAYPEITVYRHEPILTVPAETGATVAFSKGSVRFNGNGGWADRPVHTVGSPAKVIELHFETQAGGSPCFFTRTELVRALLELKVTDFAYRPVRTA